MITSRITSKAQTTVPLPIRLALGLNEGDEILYAIEDGRVILAKAPKRTASEDPFVTFSEWESEADRHAYAKL
ncbi:MAG TPA: type II toxin-antitoxin system PrlF family antitoxin [Acetobacteraceae bacterium]|nr:type II toxin-antitoxin system PrlF family antitoxin [Acetobacteraceae bacterium]